MHTVLAFVRYVHIALGFAALASFWPAALLRKGSRAHSRAGKLFALTMFASAGTSLAMASVTLLAPHLAHPGAAPERARSGAIFLSYLGVVSIIVVANGLAFARHKRDPTALLSTPRRALNWTGIALSLVVLGLGIWRSEIVLIAMSPVGLLASRKYPTHARAVADDPRAWMVGHMSAMLVAGIAVHTAFLAGGGRTFLPDFLADLGWWLWLVPTFVGTPAILWVERRLTRAPSPPAL